MGILVITCITNLSSLPLYHLPSLKAYPSPLPSFHNPPLSSLLSSFFSPSLFSSANTPPISSLHLPIPPSPPYLYFCPYFPSSPHYLPIPLTLTNSLASMSTILLIPFDLFLSPMTSFFLQPPTKLTPFNSSLIQPLSVFLHSYYVPSLHPLCLLVFSTVFILTLYVL